MLTKGKNLVKVLYDRIFIPKWPVYIFHHIPKSGGTSIRSVLSNWFRVINDYRPSVEETPETRIYLNNRVNIEELNSRYCISGHFELPGNYLHERYPQVFVFPENFRLITVLREPLQLAISLYYYQKRESKGNIKNLKLEEFLLQIKNYTAERLQCDESNYRKVLESYFYIGINEYMQDTLDQLAKLVKKPRIKIPHLNRSQRDNQISQISNSSLSLFEQNNDLDYLIYEYALKRFKEVR